MAARRRKLFIVVPLLISCGIIAGAAISYAADDGPQPLTADEVYDDTMSLEEVAAASSGKPGEVAPPCPDAKSIQELKKADLEFGPCDPLPEEGQVIILGEQPDPGEESDAVEQCPIVGGSKAAHELNVGIGCDKGARLVDWISTRDAGDACIKVTYVPEAGAYEGAPTAKVETGRHTGRRGHTDGRARLVSRNRRRVGPAWLTDTENIQRIVEITGARARFSGGSHSSFAGHALPYHSADNDPAYVRGYIYWLDETPGIAGMFLRDRAR